MAIDYDAWKHPITEIVQQYAEAFDLNYHKSDEEIITEFDMESEEDVIRRRVHLINASYHTRVPVDDMVKNIRKHKKLDELIANGKPEAVEAVACCGDKHYFVFATKYCCFGNMEKYPIYDSLSTRVLQELNDGFADVDFLKLKDTRDYEGYRDAVDKFIDHYKLKIDNYKTLDKFLWLVGKNI